MALKALGAFPTLDGVCLREINGRHVAKKCYSAKFSGLAFGFPSLVAAPEINVRSSKLTFAPDKQKGARRSERPLEMSQQCGLYIFAEHFLAVSSHTPPALSQLALSVAFVTSPAPAKAGPVKASARARANIEIRVFMILSPSR